MDLSRLPRLPDRRKAAILVDAEYLIQLADLPADTIDAFATLYAEAEEFDDKVLKDWLDKHVLISVAKQGKRSEQLVKAIVAEHERQARLEGMMHQPSLAKSRDTVDVDRGDDSRRMRLEG